MKSIANAVAGRLPRLRGLTGRKSSAAPRREPSPDGAAAVPAPPFVPPTVHPRAATQEDIFYCFRLLLDRCPNPEEWPGHSAHAGEDIAKIVAGFVTSHEFAVRGLLNNLYRSSVELLDLGEFSLFVSADDLAVG